MADRPGNKAPALRRTDFESMTHEQLVALLTSASPAGASDLATKLARASSVITKIGEDLKEYVTGLPWHGECGDAFRNWGGQTAGATLRLGEYSKGASRWMEEVSQAITEAKAAMPPLSETTQAQSDLRSAQQAHDVATDPKNRNDTDARGAARTAQSDAAAAQGRIDAARFEAVQRLRKLGQTYEFTAQQVNGVTPPTFPPPAKFMDERQWRKSTEYQTPQGVNGSSQSGWGAVGATPERLAGASAPANTAVLPQPSMAAPSGDLSLPKPAARMELDGVTTLPPAPTSPSPPQGGAPPGIRADPGIAPPGVIPPVTGGGTVKPSAPSVTGRPSAGGVRPPVLPGQGPLGSSAAGRLPRENGIIGGRPAPPSTGSPARGIPRGTVIGGEGTAAGRGPMGYNPASGMGGAGARPGATPVGRRFASETGGVVGGSPQQTGRPGTRPFTPGGTGLVPGAGSGAGAHGGGPVGRAGAVASSSGADRTSSRRNERDAARPDYLTEDEGTWRQNGRRVVPPVVD